MSRCTCLAGNSSAFLALASVRSHRYPTVQVCLLPLYILQMCYIHVCMFSKEAFVLWPQLQYIFSVFFCLRLELWADVAQLPFVRVRSVRALCMCFCRHMIYVQVLCRRTSEMRATLVWAEERTVLSSVCTLALSAGSLGPGLRLENIACTAV